MKTIKIAVPAGIGDSLWSLTKVPDLRRKLGADHVHVAIQDGLRRAKEFVEAFAFVDSASYEPFPIHPDLRRRVATDGAYDYIASQPNFQDYDWLLIANGHLERGRRLEDWLPEFETDWEIGRRFRFTAEQQEFAERFAGERGPYCVFYHGPKAGNTRDGHNQGSLWTSGEWVVLGRLVQAMGLRVVVVGAEYDRSYSDIVLAEARAAGLAEWLDAVGTWKIGRTFAVIRRARFCISYQSGIGIFCPFLGVPAGVFWRPYGDSLSPRFRLTFREEMATAWVPPEVLREGRYMGLIYTRCSPESIAEEVSGRGWVARPEPAGEAAG